MSTAAEEVERIVERVVKADEIAIGEVDLNYMVIPNAEKRADEIVEEAKHQLQQLLIREKIREREGMQFFDDDGKETFKPYVQYRFTGNGLKQSWDDRTEELENQLKEDSERREG